MLKLYKIVVLLFLFVTFGCNSNLTKEEKKALWDKAQTEGEIVRRSGTPYNIDTHRELALADAENRLISGGGLFGKDSPLIFGDKKDKDENTVGFTSFGMPVNQFLWKASIETINFMPLSSVDPMSGTIITDWYTSEPNVNERCKLNVFVNGQELKAGNLKVLSFCQKYNAGKWVNKSSDATINNKLENAILNKAKKIRLSSG